MLRRVALTLHGVPFVGQHAVQTEPECVSISTHIVRVVAAKMLMAFELFKLHWSSGLAGHHHHRRHHHQHNYHMCGRRWAVLILGGKVKCCWTDRWMDIILAGHSCRTNTVFMQLFANVLHGRRVGWCFCEMKEVDCDELISVILSCLLSWLWFSTASVDYIMEMISGTRETQEEEEYEDAYFWITRHALSLPAYLFIYTLYVAMYQGG